jgi:hypothetical protein
MGESEVDWSFFSLIDHLNRADDDPRAPDVAAWRTLLDRLAEAGELIGSSPLTQGVVDRAGAFRGLLQLLHFGLDRGLGGADPARPVFSRPWQPNRWTDEPAGGAVPSAYPAPSTRVMRLAELDPEALGARRVSPDERRWVIDERLQQVTRLQAG